MKEEGINQYAKILKDCWKFCCCEKFVARDIDLMCSKLRRTIVRDSLEERQCCQTFGRSRYKLTKRILKNQK